MRNPDKYTKNIVILRNERFFMTDCMNRAIVFLLGLLIPIIDAAADAKGYHKVTLKPYRDIKVTQLDDDLY